MTRDLNPRAMPEIDLATEYSSTTPAAPNTGITMFTRAQGRKRPAYVGTRGHDATLQPHIARNQITRVRAINANATPQVDGTAVTILSAGGTAATAVTMASTSFFTSMHRLGIRTTATAGVGASLRTSTAGYFISTTANMGGFDAIYRFGISTTSSTIRSFVGMSSTAAALSATTNPSALLTLVGFGCDAGDTVLSFMTNDASGTATKVSLGSSFPVNSSSQFYYEVGIFAPPGVAAVDWYARRLNDGVMVQGSATTDLPATATLLASHFHLSNGTTAVAAGMDIQSMYIETDN